MGGIVRKTDFVVLIGSCVDIERVEASGVDWRDFAEIDADDGRFAFDINAAFATADACVTVGERKEGLLVEIRGGEFCSLTCREITVCVCFQDVCEIIESIVVVRPRLCFQHRLCGGGYRENEKQNGFFHCMWKEKG